jgi:hypothetical protein
MSEDNVLKKFWRYLNYDLIDLILLLFFISLLIRANIGDWWRISPYIIAGIIFAIIYVLVVMWRMGGAKDLMNEFITDESIRRRLGMNPFSMRYRPVKRDLIGTIFRLVFIFGSIFIFITQIILK